MLNAIRMASLARVMAVMASLCAPAGAVEIRVFSGGALKSAVVPLTAEFERASGHAAKIEFIPMRPLQARLAKGERPDLVFITSDVLAGSGHRTAPRRASLAASASGLRSARVRW